MRPRRFYRARARLRRRLTVVVVLCAYLVATIGVPVRARVAHSGGAPFPCQDHACGCLTAAQCREHCCCYTASQRLAWFGLHGVEPQASLVAEAAAEAQHSDHDGVDEHAAPRSCCAHRTAEAAPGNDEAGHRHETAAGARPDDSPVDTRLIFSLSANTCRAISSLWCVVGAVLLPPVVSWQFQWNVVEWISPLSAPLGSLDLSPPVPPPRV